MTWHSRSIPAGLRKSRGTEKRRTQVFTWIGFLIQYRFFFSDKILIKINLAKTSLSSKFYYQRARCSSPRICWSANRTKFSRIYVYRVTYFLYRNFEKEDSASWEKQKPEAWQVSEICGITQRMLLMSGNRKNVKWKNFECLGSNVSVYFKVIDKSLTALKFAILLCNFDR